MGDLHNFPKDLMSVGRLDEKSEGLLLLTTDGKLSNYINSSKYGKEYYVLVDGAITNEAIKQMCDGIKIGFNGKKYQTKPCKVYKLSTPPLLPERSKKIRDARHGPVTWISVTLTEGKFRQVRKMTSAVGFPTLRLVRTRIHTLNLDNLSVGEVVAVNNMNQIF
mgnify:CR=1 FL=1